MLDKDQKGSNDEIEQKKKWLDERFQKLRISVLGLGGTTNEDESQKPDHDEIDERKRRATERLGKLRNLSFNINAVDPKNEFEDVPAYIRRNMSLDEGTRGENIVEGPSTIRQIDLYAQPDNNYLSLYFPLNDYDEEEISEIISLLSGLYESIGGDELEIKSIKTFEFINQLTPEFV